ncbi:MAG TPA: secretin N-terminal domain-containing protein, partial [Candidatus Limnocylindria bacterium]|nr:secretin N-terminal domain-containing protein [Candidatus Limnocylindria bacterium]
MKTFLQLLAAVWLGAIPLHAQQPSPNQPKEPVPEVAADDAPATPPDAPATETPKPAVTPTAPQEVPPRGAPRALTNGFPNRLPALPGAFPRRAATNGAPVFPSLNGSRGNTPVTGANPARPGANPAAAALQAADNGATTPADVKSASEDPTEIIDIKQMPLAQFLDIYATEAQRSVLRAQNLPLQAQIDFKAMTPLSHEERMQMYDTILVLNGVTMVPTGEKAVLAVPTAQVMQEGTAFSKATNGTDYAEASQFITHIVQVKHVSVEEAVETIKQFAKNQNGIIGLASTKTIVIRDYAINVKRMLEVLERIDVDNDTDFALEVIPIKYGRVEDIYATMSSVIGGGGGTGGAIPGGGGLTGRSRGGLRGGTGGIGTGGYGTTGGYGNTGGYGSSYGGGYGGSRIGGGYGTYSAGEFSPQAAGTSVISPGGAPTGAAARTGTGGSFQGRYNSTAKGGTQIEPLVTDAQITPDVRGNALIVYASKKDMATIKRVLEKVDTLLPQVMIEGIIMSVTLGDDWSLGVTYGQHPQYYNGNGDFRGGGAVNNPGDSAAAAPLGGLGFLTNAATAFPATSGFAYFAKLGKNWEAMVDATASDSRIDVIQRPRIITSHAVPANFFVGKSVPFKQGDYSYGGGGTSSTYSQLQVGVTLSVEPYITPDGLVVMQVEQEIEDIDGKVDPSGSVPPTTSRRSTDSQVSVNSGDTVLLGGYINNTSQKGNSGVPL